MRHKRSISIRLEINRNRLSPITLTSKNGISQTVIYLSSTNFIFFQIGHQFRSRFFVIQAIYHARIDIFSFFGGICLGFDVCLGIQNRDDGQTEMRRKIPVTLIARRYAHYGTCSITRQNVICNPNRHTLAVERIDAVRTGKRT